MAQRCPFCKTRLWTDPWFSKGVLRCPRCGNEFKPWVSWGSFRILVLSVILLGVSVLAILPARVFWIVLFLGVLGFLLWYFPRLINLHPISEFSPAEGLPQNKEDKEWEEKLERLAESARYRRMLLVVVLLALILVLAFGLRSWIA